MRCSDGESESRGVRERHFDLDGEGRRVPGLLWTPTGAAVPPAEMFVSEAFLAEQLVK